MSKIVSATTLTFDLTLGGVILYTLLFKVPVIVDYFSEPLSPFDDINRVTPSKSALNPVSALKSPPILLATV